MEDNRFLPVGALLALLVLPGCDATTDPNKGGLFGGLNGLASGAYNQRVADRQARLDGVQQAVQRLTVDSNQLESEAGSAAARRQSLGQQLDSLASRTAALKAQTRRLQAGTEDQQRQRTELDARLDRMRADLERLRREADEKRMSAEAVDREKRRLEYEIEELTKVANALR